MTLRSARLAGAALALAAAAIALGVSVVSCQQAATNVAAKTLELPQKLDVVCLEVNDVNGVALPAPIVHPVNDCPAVATTNTNPTALPLHLYAAVTQSRRGELGVVDLTAGVVVDVDRTTPGTDFIPVGANPTDIVVTPSGKFTFVTSAAPNKFGVYGVDNARLLGDSTGDAAPPRITDDWACLLEQPPQAIGVLSESPSPTGGRAPAVVLAVVLGGFVGAPAQLVTVAFDPNIGAMTPGVLDPCRVLGSTALTNTVPDTTSATPVSWPDGVPYADAGPLDFPSLGPSCMVSASEAGAVTPEADASADGGAMGSDDAGGGGEAGIEEGGNDAGAEDAAAIDATTADAGTPNPGGGDATLGGEPAAEASAPAWSPPTPASPMSLALRSDKPFAYVGDSALPLIHIVDLRDPTNPVEVDPLVATSVVAPQEVGVGPIALSPPTHDNKTYLYAVDSRQGNLMVFDVTDAPATSRLPLRRPHGALSPQTPIDRISFGAPVKTIAFALHDWPLNLPNDPTHSYTGLVCNPNPNAYVDGGVFLDRGAFYRADQTSVIQPTDTLGGTVQSMPGRLRGIFAFATLTTGSVMVIDVDDLDAPCRRPNPMEESTRTGVLDLPQPPPNGPTDLDPYHAPDTDLIPGGRLPSGQSAVTQEGFFPVSAPHRPRASTLLRSDSTVGIRLPQLPSVPQLFSASGAAVATAPGTTTSQLLMPTPLPPNFVDPSLLVSGDAGTIAPAAAGGADQSFVYPGCTTTSSPSPCTALSGPPNVRIAFDDPTAHVDQTWTVTYEGALPISGIAADIAPVRPAQSPDVPADYSALVLSAPGAHFCAAGVEDWRIGKARAAQVVDAVQKAFEPALPAGTPPPTGIDPQQRLASWTTDYVEINDDLLVSTDPYWAVNDDCWEDNLAGPPGVGLSSDKAGARYDFCASNFGATASTDADTHLLRDLPILEAYDDSFLVTRFGWGPPAGTDAGAAPVEQTTNRTVSARDPSNASWLKAVRCCFHHQATFKVRTGGEWVAIGSVSGYLHHVTADPSTRACVLSCDPNQALLNARSFDIPWATADQSADPTATRCTPAPITNFLPQYDRDSPIAMRNPMFSFVTWGACGPHDTYDHTLSTRDLSWRFQLAGSSTPISVSIVTAGAGNAVSPQSMKYIVPFGQMAVVDAEQQGLVLIDLNVLQVLHQFL